MRVLLLVVSVLGLAGATSEKEAVGQFVACDPCSQKCAVPCNTPHAALPVVWDSTPDKPDPVIHHGEFNLNPYNSIRPEYRDAPPSKADLEKIWQHHLKDHAYKSPFVRPMKSGLWEAGVPNRYAPSGYNRRKFKKEEDALAYVRHKTGAGSAIDYQGALRSEMEIKEHDAGAEEEIFEKGGIHGTNRRREKSTRTHGSGAFIEASSSQRSPTSDLDINEKEASAADLKEDDKVLTVGEQKTRNRRDYSLKVAHKIRDMLANYVPDHEVKVLHPGFKA